MSGILSVLWTVTPATPPEPILFCTSCKCAKPFGSSDKFRLNANGKQLDAWLIYRCTSCSNTWNRPVFERVNVRKIKPAILSALQANDPGLAKEIAFDLHQLRRHSPDFREAAAVQVLKQVLSDGGSSCDRLEIVFAMPVPTSMRTDRLLARELNISRTRLRKLAEAPEQRMLRRPIRNGLSVSLVLGNVSDCESIGLATRN